MLVVISGVKGRNPRRVKHPSDRDDILEQR